MFETILAIVVTWQALTFFVILGLFCERAESHFWSDVWLVASIAVAFMYFHISLAAALYSSIGYIALGLVWSFWKYKRYIGRKFSDLKASGEVQRENLERNRVSHSYTSERYEQTKVQLEAELKADFEILRKELHPKRKLDSIVAWVVSWPFSFVETSLHDIINLVETLVKDVFNKAYLSIYNAAIKKMSDQ